MEQLSEFVVNHWILVTAFCVVCSLLLSSFLNQTSGLSAPEAVMAVNREKAVVVDVREEKDFISGHIANAINIPRKDFSLFSERLTRHKNKPLIVCCSTGSASNGAVRELKKIGFEQSFVLKGGVVAWKSANYPLVRPSE
jgi:rhodanese-related sulfurtransferase